MHACDLLGPFQLPERHSAGGSGRRRRRTGRLEGGALERVADQLPIHLRCVTPPLAQPAHGGSQAANKDMTQRR